MIKRISILFVVFALYHVNTFSQSIRVIEWGTNSVTVEALLSASSVISCTAYGTPLSTKLTDAVIDVGIYRIPVTAGDLSYDEGLLLSLSFYDDIGTFVHKADIRIPVIISTDEYITSHDVSVAATTDLVVLDGACARIDPDAETYTFRKVIVQSGASLVVPAGAELRCDSLIMRSGALIGQGSIVSYQYRYPQLVCNGSFVNTSGKILYDYLLNDAHYYTLCLPYSAVTSAIRYEDGQSVQLGKTLLIEYYDGAVRATGADGWKPFRGNSLEAGVGYTIALRPQYIRVGSASPTQRSYEWLRIPMVADLSSGETAVGKAATVSSYPAARDNDAGWNLVGNPYLASYGGAVGGLASNGIGLLVTNASGGYDWQGTVRYVVIPNEDGTGYMPMLASAASLPAFKNFFVQIGSGDALSFDLSSRRQNTPAYMSDNIGMSDNTDPTESSDDTVLMLQLSDANSSDCMGILVGDDYTSFYEIGADLSKWLNSGLNIYALPSLAASVADALSFIAVDETLAHNISLGYTASKVGTYTFSLDHTLDYSSFSKVLLYDVPNNVTTDLLLDDYEFSVTGVMPMMDNSRFTLSLVRRENLPSGIDEQVFGDGQPIKYLIDGRLLISSDGVLYDVLGQKW